MPFSRDLYIERDDFMEEPPKKFYRLAPGREVRLRYAYFLTCREAIKDARRRVGRACAAPTTRRAAAENHPTGARSRPRCIGSRSRMRCPPRSGSTTICSTSPTPTSARDLKDQPQPRIAERARGLPDGTGAIGGGSPASRFSSSGSATSAATPIRRRSAPSSTAPWRYATPGHASKPKAAVRIRPDGANARTAAQAVLVPPDPRCLGVWGAATHPRLNFAVKSVHTPWYGRALRTLCVCGAVRRGGGRGAVGRGGGARRPHDRWRPHR